MNKQIEEMARVMCGMNKPCILCELQSPCLMRNCAHLLYAEDYRKTADVAMEIIDLLTEIGNYFMSRGDILQMGAIMAAIDTIKKKYESEGADGV